MRPTRRPRTRRSPLPPWCSSRPSPPRCPPVLPPPTHPSPATPVQEEDEEEPPPVKKLRRDTFEKSRSGSPLKKTTLPVPAPAPAPVTPVPAATSTPAPEGRQSYEASFLREPVPPTQENYNIDDLRSDDETDDECDPRKEIPAWALGGNLKGALIRQHYSKCDPRNIFGPTYAPILEQVRPSPSLLFLPSTLVPSRCSSFPGGASTSGPPLPTGTRPSCPRPSRSSAIKPSQSFPCPLSICVNVSHPFHLCK